MKSIIHVSMLVFAGTLAAARPASACSTISPVPGLALAIDDEHPITRDGVILVRGEAFSVDVDAALDDLLWEVRRDGVVLPGSFEVVPLWDRAATTAVQEDHVFALIWRADAPLAPDGTYTLDFGIQTPYGPAPGQVTMTVTTPVGPVLPELRVGPGSVLVDPTEVVCCETGLDSCDDSSRCETLRATQLPAIEVDLGDEGDSTAQQILWVARVLPGGVTGPRLQSQFAYRVEPWRWSGTVVFDAPAEQYCLVAGATSVRDGSEVVSDPQCFTQAELGVPHQAQLVPSAAMEPYEPETISEGQCVGPIVYEADGAAYPRGSEEPAPASGGCSVAPRSPAWLVLLLALVRRAHARVRARVREKMVAS